MSTLTDAPPPPTKNCSADRPALLCLMHLLPWPLEGGGQLKSYYVLRALAAKFDVRLIALTRHDGEDANCEPLRAFCALGIETVRLPRSRVTNITSALSAIFRQTSFIIDRDDTPQLRQSVERELASRAYAALHVDHLQMMQFVPANTGATQVVLDNHNVEWRIPKRLAETASNPLSRWYANQEWPKLKKYEAAAVRRSGLTLAVSDEDARELREMAGNQDRVVAVPIGVDLDYFAATSSNVAHAPSHTLLSIGTMYWPPNVDALLYFTRDILPILRVSVPDAKLNIVGARPAPAIVALGEADPQITVTGRVPDVRPYAKDCGAFIVPLRSGSGMRVKILNALAMGLPVVSTTVGAEGIDITNGENILIADTPEDFAQACVRLLTEPGLGTRLGRAGRALMEAGYGWSSVENRLLTVYDNLMYSSVQRH